MNPTKDRFPSRSPIQRDRISPVPLVIAAVILAAVAWQARESWVDASAPPYADQPDRSASHGGAADRRDASAARRASGNLTALFSADDYPPEALRNTEEGTATVRLQIDATGKVSACAVVQSSGSAALDEATCTILSSRARFTPARDSQGRPARDSTVQRISWQLR